MRDDRPANSSRSHKHGSRDTMGGRHRSGRARESMKTRLAFAALLAMTLTSAAQNATPPPPTGRPGAMTRNAPAGTAPRPRSTQECRQAEAALVHPAGRAGGQICALHHDRAGAWRRASPRRSGPNDMLFILGANDMLFALDANSGKLALAEKLSQSATSPQSRRTGCAPTPPTTRPPSTRRAASSSSFTSDGMLRGLSWPTAPSAWRRCPWSRPSRAPGA